MSLCKWSCICLLGGLILIGWPAAVSCESSSEDKHPPGVKECRVHIEKALEQYWDKEEPEEISNPTEDNNANYLDESNSNEEENIRKEQKDSNHLETPDYTQDDEVGKPPNDEENNNDDEEIDDNESNTDDEEIEDNDEDDTDDTDAEDDEEDTNDDEEDGNVQNTNTINESVEEGLDDEEEAENEEEESINEDIDHNNEDDDENDETSEDRNDYEQDGDEIELTASNTFEESASNDEDGKDLHDDSENDRNETNSKEESTENVENDLNSDESKEDEGNVDEADDAEEEDEGEESENKKEAEKSWLDESNGNKNDTIPEEQSAEDDKANEEVPEEEKRPTEETEETESEQEEKEDDSIENIYEEEEELELHTFRSREHIDVILGIDEIGTGTEKEEEKLAQSVFRDIKKTETTHIKPVELLYKYADSTTRVLGDAEIFSKPMLLFLGPWGAGKTSAINYLLGLERTTSALKTSSTGITDVDFTLLTYGTQRRLVSGTELAADWKYAGVQKFGQGFLDHFRSIHIPHPLLQKVTIIDSPGIVENRKSAERGYPLNAVFQWFIDRADAIYVVLDPSKVDIGGEVGSVIEQLQGQNVRFLLNKADSIRRSDLMRVVGQLFWNLSPLLGGAEAPLIYAVSLISHPFHPSAPAKFLADQEKNFLYDIKGTLEKRVENKILYARKHAVRVRNHAKMVDCYLASYYRHKSIFSNKRNVAKLITENPREYNIYDGLTSMTNVSRSDIPNPLVYKEFFKIHPLYDFKPLASTCSYFRGCPMDKVDLAITKEFPELLAKYKEAKRALYGQVEQDR